MAGEIRDILKPAQSEGLEFLWRRLSQTRLIRIGSHIPNELSEQAIDLCEVVPEVRHPNQLCGTE
jgi:hypothetical protein